LTMLLLRQLNSKMSHVGSKFLCFFAIDCFYVREYAENLEKEQTRTIETDYSKDKERKK